MFSSHFGLLLQRTSRNTKRYPPKNFLETLNLVSQSELSEKEGLKNCFSSSKTTLHIQFGKPSRLLQIQEGKTNSGFPKTF